MRIEVIKEERKVIVHRGGIDDVLFEVDKNDELRIQTFKNTSNSSRSYTIGWFKAERAYEILSPIMTWLEEGMLQELFEEEQARVEAQWEAEEYERRLNESQDESL